MSETFTADIIQFMRPDGRQVERTVELPKQFEPNYLNMINSGCRFESEVLSTGEVSLTLANTAEEEDVDIEVVENGPEVPLALVGMLKRLLWYPKGDSEKSKE